MLFFSRDALFLPLVGDALSHSQQSQIFGMTAVLLMAPLIPALGTMQFSSVLFAVNIVLLGGFLCAYFGLRRRRVAVKIIFWSSAFCLIRAGDIYFGGNGSPHPPLGLLPLWLTSSLLGVNSFSFRVSQFLCLILFMWLVQRVTSEKLGIKISWAFALAIGTIPVVWHTAVLVEQSVWTACMWTLLVLVLRIRSEEFSDSDYFKWFCVASLVALIRQPAFVALVPILFLYLYDTVREKRFNVRRFLFVISPIAAIFPFVTYNILIGTPATTPPVSGPYAGFASSPALRLVTAIDSGVIVNSVTNSLGIWAAFIIPASLAFITKPARWLAILLFFAAAIYVFYSISPGLWGIGRYQAEYAAPFAILGFFATMRVAQKRWSLHPYVLLCILGLLVSHNIYTYNHIARNNPSVDVLNRIFYDAIKSRGGYSIMSEFPYAYDDAFDAVRRRGLGNSVYVAGVTYGVFPEILHGFSVAEIESIIPFATTSPDPSVLNADERIQAILVADLPSKVSLIDGLMQLGWARKGEFKNSEYGSTIFLLLRAPPPNRSDASLIGAVRR